MNVFFSSYFLSLDALKFYNICKSIKGDRKGNVDNNLGVRKDEITIVDAPFFSWWWTQ